MSKCSRCKLNILDDSVICPLCNGILEIDENLSHKRETAGEDNLAEEAAGLSDAKEENSTGEPIEDIEVYPSKSVMYPDVNPAMKRINFVIKLFVFFSVLVELVLILINYLTYNGVKWSMICGAALVYACFTLVYSFKHNRSHRNKLIVQSIGAIVLCVLIDVALGYTGWSLDYAAPSAIMVVDVLVVVLMFINIDNWQNYIMSQIGLLLLSLLFLILNFMGYVNHPLLTIIAVGVTGLILIATVVFGDKKATTELSRRFRV